MYPLRPDHLTTLTSLALALTLGFSHSQAQVLLNGSFESPILAANSDVGTVTDWTQTAAASVTVSNDFENLGNTPYGSQYLGLNSNAVVSQTITGFIAGDTYVLGADFATISGPESSFTLAISGAANDSQTLTSLTSGPYGSGIIPFQSSVLIFQATTSGSATITLTDSGGDGSLAVDNVALYGGIQLIPEPTTTAEILLGLGALAGFAALRRTGAFFWSK